MVVVLYNGFTSRIEFCVYVWEYLFILLPDFDVGSMKNGGWKKNK